MSIASAISALQSASSDIASAIEAKGVTVPSGSGYDDYASLIASIPSGGGSNFDDWVKDGDTHLWIKIVNKAQLAQTIRIRMIGTIDWGDGTTKDTANVTTYTTFSHTYTELGKYRIDLHPTSGIFYIGGNGASYNVMGTRNDKSYSRRNVLYQAEIGTSIITKLSDYAFYQCLGLNKLWIPKTITDIGQACCHTCSGLKELYFEDPATVTSGTFQNNLYQNSALQFMTPWAFSNGSTTLNTCARSVYSLTEFTIPSFITNIAANTFYQMFGLKHFWCLPTTAPTVANSNAFSSFPTECVIHVPYGSLPSYQGGNIWSTYSSQMVEAGTVTYNLTNVTRDNITPMVAAGESFTTTLTPAEGKTLGTVTVKMGGTDITSTAYSAGVVSIASVTGNIVITASAS